MAEDLVHGGFRDFESYFDRESMIESLTETLAEARRMMSKLHKILAGEPT